MTTEHLRPLHDDARAQIPDVAVRMVRLGRLTALSKPDGGVRGIVAGDVIRRLVGRTMAQQLSQAVEAATARPLDEGWLRGVWRTSFKASQK